MESMTLSLWVLVGVVLLGFILDLVSFATPYWNRFDSGETWGLWQRCLVSHGCDDMPLDHLSDTMAAGRVLEVLGLVAYVTLLVVLCLYIFWKRDRRLISAAMIISLVVLTSVSLGAILWASSVNTSLYWCYYLCYVSGLSVAGCGATLLHIRRQTYIKSIPTISETV